MSDLFPRPASTLIAAAILALFAGAIIAGLIYIAG